MTGFFFPSSWLPILSPQFHFKCISLSTQHIPWSISCSLMALCQHTRTPTNTRTPLKKLVSTASLNPSSLLGLPKTTSCLGRVIYCFIGVSKDISQKAIVITLSHKDRFNAKDPYMVNSMMVTISLEYFSVLVKSILICSHSLWRYQQHGLVHFSAEGGANLFTPNKCYLLNQSLSPAMILQIFRWLVINWTQGICDTLREMT